MRSHTGLLKVALLVLTGVTFAACSSVSSSKSARTTSKVTAPLRTTTAPSSTEPDAAAPTAPNNPSTLEGAGVPVTLLLQQIGSGSGESRSFTPAGSVAPSQVGPGSAGIVRLRVEWACSSKSEVANVHLADGSGDISGALSNGFDGPVPVSDPPAKVVWTVEGQCNWHVRALDQ